MKKTIFFFLVGLLLFGLLFGCNSLMPPQQPVTSVQHQQKLQHENFTLGKVQKEIRVGMSQAEVVSALGSPNIISADEDGNESWVYDRIATEVRYSNSSQGRGVGVSGGAGLGGVGVLILGLAGVGASYQQGQSYGAGSSIQSERTFTVIIKFDKHKRVKSFSYHLSRF